MKTISIPEELHKELIGLKLEERKKNAAQLIEELILEYKKQRFLTASGIFRNALKERKLSFSALLEKSAKIRKEISNEWF